MRYLVASCFNRSILNFSSDGGGKDPLWLVFMGEVGMVPSIALDADPPALLGHAENESPAIFGVEIGISENQEALVVLKLDVFLEIIEDVSGMKLFDFGIWSYSGTDDLFLF